MIEAHTVGLKTIIELLIRFLEEGLLARMLNTENAEPELQALEASMISDGSECLRQRVRRSVRREWFENASASLAA